MNADELDSLTERVLGAVFEVTNTLIAGRCWRVSAGTETQASNEHRMSSSGPSPGNRSGDRSMALRIA
jgi:hypothetical protein